MITVTGLTIAKDLKNATVRVSIYPEDKQKLAMHAVRHAASHIRHGAAELVAMRQMPFASVFELDTDGKTEVCVLEGARKAGRNAARASRPAPAMIGAGLSGADKIAACRGLVPRRRPAREFERSFQKELLSLVKKLPASSGRAGAGGSGGPAAAGVAAGPAGAESATAVHPRPRRNRRSRSSMSRYFTSS